MDTGMKVIDKLEELPAYVQAKDTGAKLIRQLEELPAYLNAIEGYVYGFPLVIMDLTKGVLTAASKSGEYSAPMDQFARVRTYVDPDFKNVVRISRNSLWAHGFIDLDRGPFVYSQPDTRGRYIVMQALNMWTDDFATTGSRTTGTEAGDFLIAGPKWKGAAPSHIKQTFNCSTRYAWVLVQIAAASEQEFPEIHQLQDQLRLTPLSAGESYTPADNVPVDPTVDTTVTPYDQIRLMSGVTFFKRLAMVMKDNPPYAADVPVLKKLKKIGVEPGKDFNTDTLDPKHVEALNRAAKRVWNEIESAPLQMPNVNGWCLPINLGRFGTDYNTRAVIAWLGLGALPAEDAIYPTTWLDGDGKPLDGAGKYTIHFAKDGLLPSYSGVWSISAYRENFYVRNPIERYGLLSSMPLIYNADGSLDVYIQAQSTGADKEANWLPCPPSGPFNLSIRVYQPKEAMLDGRSEHNLVVQAGTYAIPPVQRVP
jgi:hypothetical protein